MATATKPRQSTKSTTKADQPKGIAVEKRVINGTANLLVMLGDNSHPKADEGFDNRFMFGNRKAKTLLKAIEDNPVALQDMLRSYIAGEFNHLL